MVREFEPRKDPRNRGWLTNIIHKPRFDSSMDSVQWRDQYMKWLEDVDDYETTMEDIVGPSVRIAVAYENAPGYLQNQLRVIKESVQNDFDEFHRMVTTYLDARFKFFGSSWLQKTVGGWTPAADAPELPHHHTNTPQPTPNLLLESARNFTPLSISAMWSSGSGMEDRSEYRSQEPTEVRVRGSAGRRGALPLGGEAPFPNRSVRLDPELTVAQLVAGSEGTRSHQWWSWGHRRWWVLSDVRMSQHNVFLQFTVHPNGARPANPCEPSEGSKQLWVLAPRIATGRSPSRTREGPETRRDREPPSDSRSRSRSPAEAPTPGQSSGQRYLSVERSYSRDSPSGYSRE